MSDNLKYSQRDKDVIFGFIRNAQRLLPFKENPYYTIPALVAYVVLPYFAAIEYFTKHGTAMTLSDDKFTCKNNRRTWSTVYCAFDINDKTNYNKVIWDLLINIPKSETLAVLGIDGSNKNFPDKSINNSNVLY